MTEMKSPFASMGTGPTAKKKRSATPVTPSPSPTKQKPKRIKGGAGPLDLSRAGPIPPNHPIMDSFSPLLPAIPPWARTPTGSAAKPTPVASPTPVSSPPVSSPEPRIWTHAWAPITPAKMGAIDSDSDDSDDEEVTQMMLDAQSPNCLNSPISSVSTTTSATLTSPTTVTITSVINFGAAVFPTTLSAHTTPTVSASTVENAAPAPLKKDIRRPNIFSVARQQMCWNDGLPPSDPPNIAEEEPEPEPTSSWPLRAYVVWVGEKIGVFQTWEEVHPLVQGFPGSRFKSFATRGEALGAFRHAKDAGALGRITKWNNGYYVVVKGLRPGVYFGRVRAAASLGAVSAGHLVEVRSFAKGQALFDEYYARGKVFTIAPNSRH